MATVPMPDPEAQGQVPVAAHAGRTAELREKIRQQEATVEEFLSRDPLTALPSDPAAPLVFTVPGLPGQRSFNLSVAGECREFCELAGPDRCAAVQREMAYREHLLRQAQPAAHDRSRPPQLLQPPSPQQQPGAESRSIAQPEWQADRQPQQPQQPQQQQQQQPPTPPPSPPRPHGPNKSPRRRPGTAHTVHFPTEHR